MPVSLYVEEQPHGLAFYMNGALQFHTADERIYHERLTIPAIALAVQRFPETPLQVLICGGGDGLVAREVLKFPQVARVDLVDVNPEVLALGRTTFAPFNAGSLTDARVEVCIAEAFAFLAERAGTLSYHAIVCDFTYPASVAETQIHSVEWYTLVARSLHPGGIVAVNAVSPQQTPQGYWCIYRTMQLAGLLPKPHSTRIPSFCDRDYGDWGFFLAGTEQPITYPELATVVFPEDLQVFTRDQLLTAFTFPPAIAHWRHGIAIHRADTSQLLFYLLNPHPLDPHPSLAVTSGALDFLQIADADAASTLVAAGDPLSLESLVQQWLSGNDLEDAMPAQHTYQTPQMTRESLQSLRHLLKQVDFSLLFQKLQARSSQLPSHFAIDFPQLLARGRNYLAELDDYQRQTLVRAITAVSVTLLVANIVTPDTVFAKGSYGGSSGAEEGLGPMGLILTIVGVGWLAILSEEESKS